jgi:hypothetical protein
MYFSHCLSSLVFPRLFPSLARLSAPLLLHSQAVSGMLPKNALRVERMKQLKIYTAETHPHVAQFPLQLTAASPIEAYVSFPCVHCSLFPLLVRFSYGNVSIVRLVVCFLRAERSRSDSPRSPKSRFTFRRRLHERMSINHPAQCAVQSSSIYNRGERKRACFIVDHLFYY